MGNFTQDLKIGQKAQDFIIKELELQFPGLKSVQGNFSNYDLISDSGYTAEVKFDIKSKLTNNVGIEYEYNKEPSGLAKTKAMEWIHIYFLQGSWVYSRIKTADLKAFIKSNWKYLKKLSGGDRNSSKMILINSEDFGDTFNYTPIRD